MVKNILLVGVGGQGTILTSKILAAGLTELGYDVKMAEIHGMSQRGGSVVTQVRYGEEVFAPNIDIGAADVIVAFEKVEALRMLPYLKKGGVVVADEKEIYPVSVLAGGAYYPHETFDELEKAGVQLRVVPAAAKAEELGNGRAQNIYLLGALIKVLGLTGADWERIVGEYVPAKAKELNLLAFKAGLEGA